MSRGLYLVLSDPASSIDEGEYNVWYDRHIREVLEVPGFLAARRYRLVRQRGDEFPAQFRFVAIYEVDRPKGELRAALDATGADRDHPTWWENVERSSLMAESLSGGPDPTGPDRLYATFSVSPPGVPFDAYNQWYDEHSGQNIAASALLAEVWRYRLSSVAPTDQRLPEHLALYALGGAATEMLAQTQQAQDAGHVSSIEGFHSVASFQADTISVRIEARS